MQEVILDKKAVVQAKNKMNFLFKLGKDSSFSKELSSILANSKNIKTSTPLSLITTNTLNNTKIAKNEKTINDIKLNTLITNSNLILNSQKKQENSNILSQLLSNKDVKANKIQKIVDNAKELNEKLPDRLKIGKEELLEDIKEELFKENTNTLLSDISFTETLQFISLLKQNTKDVSLTEFSSFKDIIKQNKISDFKDCKNLSELYNLAKENKLNIKNISYEIIKNQEYNENILNNKFPILAQQSFFAKNVNNINEQVKNIIQEKSKIPNEKTQEENIIANKQNTQNLKQGKLFELINENKNINKEENKEIKENKDIKDIKENKEVKNQTANTQTHTQNIQNQVKQNNEKNEINIKMQNITKENEENLNTQENKNTTFLLNTQESKSDESTVENIESKASILKNDNLIINNIKLDKEQIKSTINTFAQDFKDELAKFKAPIHKVDINLNPKELGEINVTMIARGNNLHINLNSQNQNTLNLFIQNQQEFKNSMVNMGFTGINMNFGDKKEQEQQQRQHNQNTKRNSFNDEEENNAPIEIVLNRYL